METKKNTRLGEEQLNNQGCLMRIVKYNRNRDIIVEFQDKYKAKIHTSYQFFSRGEVKNPYHPSVYGIGMIGTKYKTSLGRRVIKEYETWKDMLRRCFDEKTKQKTYAYRNVTCCDEWLLYENFYEWLHKQENFDKWYNGERWCLDKDILLKGNKMYSPDTCCLVPQNVNKLFIKNSIVRGSLPIGVVKHGSKYLSCCANPTMQKQKYLGTHLTMAEAFQAYKTEKENCIKQIAQMEHSNGNITERCYEAMMDYRVEITD